MEPIDLKVYYGIKDRSFLDAKSIQMDLLPDKLHQLRWKLNQKAKNEPKFRFYSLYGFISRMDVLEAAWKHVGKNKKAAGIDGVRAEDVRSQEGGVKAFLEDLANELKHKRYRASAVRRVYIPKGDGKKRPLGIPTLKDRVVQMAVLLIIEPIFEADFLGCSYGFRSGRNAHDALESIRGHIKSGRKSVYDADLKGYFDNIPHDKLIACLEMRIVDRQLLKLIKGWLKAPVIEENESGKKQPPRKNDKGTPQGGVISPLLANLYLHWFDKLFHRKDGPFIWANARLVRYADDFVVLAKYQGQRLEHWISYQLENWMGLEINREKTTKVDLGNKESLDFLGFTFRYCDDLKGRNWSYLNLEPSKKAQQKARDGIRLRTGPNMCFKPTPDMIKELNEFTRGWSGYFNFGYPRKAFRDLGAFVDNRVFIHLNRRSQRKYHRPKGISHYAYLRNMGLNRL